MAVNAGTVYYTVDADTQKAIDAAAEMNKSLVSVQTTMAKTDQQIKKHTQEWTKSGNTISKTGVVLDKFGDINVEATAKMQKLMSETEALSKHAFYIKSAFFLLISLIVLTFVIFSFEFVATRFFVLFGPF